jgi:hypothetical protein
LALLCRSVAVLGSVADVRDRDAMLSGASEFVV